MEWRTGIALSVVFCCCALALSVKPETWSKAVDHLVSWVGVVRRKLERGAK